MRFPVCAAVFSFVLLGLSLAAIIAPTLVVASGSSSLYSYYVGFGMFQACVEYKTNAVVVLGVTVTSASEYDKCMTYDNFEKSTYNVYAPDGITDAETGGYLFATALVLHALAFLTIVLGICIPMAIAPAACLHFVASLFYLTAGIYLVVKIDSGNFPSNTGWSYSFIMCWVLWILSGCCVSGCISQGHREASSAGGGGGGIAYGGNGQMQV